MTRAALAPLAAVLLLLTGCGGDESPEPDAATPTTTAATTAPTTTAAAPAKSPRGNLVKQIGEEAGMGKPGEAPVLSWTVTGITVDAPCTREFTDPPEAGHFVVASIEAETSPAYPPGLVLNGFHPVNWKVIDAEGFTREDVDTSAALICHGADWPQDLAPGSRYRFSVTLDSPSPTGVLVFNPTEDGGWEYPF
ncbi:hypothetical protein [Nocardia puris]|uniref:LppP/LprE lipoprotein n=1 Tax=Nocardia puris TaxID=208602 RepID=A0A366CW58_9NOCA|nr:hypothetical protein [Nocardia puris]RBO82053.1 hypothetical protein DFR74_1258 [Nocardia puris]